MPYHEKNLTNDPKAQITIRPGHFSPHFDIDSFGMDDACDQDPQHAFRMILQLGSGYMIYLYVIQMSFPGSDHFFHTFWIKDCAVAEIDMEDCGAPKYVHSNPLELPKLFKYVKVESNGRYEFHEIHKQIFEAHTDSLGIHLKSTWHLDNGQQLQWDNQSQWHWIGNDSVYKLGKDTYLKFLNQKLV